MKRRNSNAFLKRFFPSGKYVYVTFVLLGILLGAIVHLNLSCLDSFNFGEEEETIDLEGITTMAQQIETAFLNSDTIALSGLLTETSKGVYANSFSQIEPYMAGFGEAFKARKLLYASPIFAVFEFKSDGSTHTLEMAAGDNGEWLLTRF